MLDPGPYIWGKRIWYKSFTTHHASARTEWTTNRLASRSQLGHRVHWSWGFCWFINVQWDDGSSFAFQHYNYQQQPMSH